MLRAHPNAIGLISAPKQFAVTPTALRPTETALRLLREVGLSEEDAVKAFCALGGFIVGFVMFEIGVTRAPSFGDQPPTAQALMATFPTEDFPCFMTSLPYLMSATSTSASNTGWISSSRGSGRSPPTDGTSSLPDQLTTGLGARAPR